MAPHIAIKDRRLNSALRDRLEKFARSKVTTPVEDKAYADLYKEALPQVVAVVMKRYPLEDLQVLRRYDLTQQDSCFFMNKVDNDVRFELDTEIVQTIPLEVPKGSSCWGRVYLVSKELEQLVQNVNLAKYQRKQARSKKNDLYTRAIRSAATFNELASVWPAVEQLRMEIVGDISPKQRALSVMSTEMVEFLREDNAGAVA